MDSRWGFRNLIAQFGVEIGLAAIIACGAFFAFYPQFLFEQRSTVNSEEARRILQNIQQAVVAAHEAQVAFLKSKKEDELSRYNDQVLVLNNRLGQLLKVVSKDAAHLQRAIELNKILKQHFESINSQLTRHKLSNSVRPPASTAVLEAIESNLQPFSESKSKKFSSGVLGIFAVLIFFFILLSRRLTNRKFKIEQARRLGLENRSILLDTILNSMSDALIVIDSDGHFTHYNAAAQKIIGNKIKSFAQESSVTESGFYTSHGGEPLSKRDLPIIKSLRGEKIDDQEFYIENGVRPDGVYVIMSSRPINNIDGGISGALAVFRDISRRKMVEHEWIRAREAAVEASLKKSDFMAAMSHEIRTPMNGVVGMATLLSDTPLNSEQREYVGIVKRSAESLIMLINDILDFSKIEAGKLQLDNQPFNLRILANDIIEMFKPAVAEKSVQLHFNMNEKFQWCFQGDSGRIRQILVNLVGNAIKFTQQGMVAVEISKVVTDGTTCKLKFEVKDTGSGLKADECNSLFQKYFQTKTGMKVGGTGLGLSISKQLVSLMDGEIGVESAVGFGSNFWFTITLPVVSLKDVPNSNEFTFSKMFNGVVLLAEDQLVNQKVAQAYLKRLGLEVEVVSNGVEAVALFKKRKFDLVFMDCQMPLLNGFEATKQIRYFEKERNEHCPIIALTADVSMGEFEKYKSAGMDERLSKPLELTALIGLLTRILKSNINTIDISALAELDSYRVQDKNLVDALIEDFAISTPELINSMKRGLITFDREAIFQAAHSLKSTSASLGAMKLSEICEQIENNLDSEQFNYLVHQAEHHFQICLKDLKNFSEKRSAS